MLELGTYGYRGHSGVLLQRELAHRKYDNGAFTNVVFSFYPIGKTQTFKDAFIYCANTYVKCIKRLSKCLWLKVLNNTYCVLKILSVYTCTSSTFVFIAAKFVFLLYSDL